MFGFSEGEFSPGQWHICYACVVRKEWKTTLQKTDAANDSKLRRAMQFGKTLLINLIQPPWSSANEGNSISKPNGALAFIKVAEFVASKLVGLMSEGQSANLSIDQVLQMHLEVAHSNIGYKPSIINTIMNG